METLERFFSGGWVQPGDNPTHRQTSIDRWQWLFFLSVDSHDNNTKKKIDNSSVNIQSHSRSLCSSNETGRWEQPRATVRLQHASIIQNNFLWSVPTLLCQWNYFKKKKKAQWKEQGQWSMLLYMWPISLDSVCLMGAKTWQRSFILKQREKKDMLGCLVMFNHAFVSKR